MRGKLFPGSAVALDGHAYDLLVFGTLSLIGSNSAWKIALISQNDLQ